MKTNKLIIYFCSIIGALFFTSCLDSGDDSLRINRDIAYITTKNGSACAATRSGYVVTAAQVQTMLRGEFYFVSYEINNSQVDGVYVASEFTKLSDEPIPQTSLKWNSEVPEDRGLAIVELSTPIFAVDDYWNDRWVFGYTVKIGENDGSEMVFYYDKDNQIDKDGKDISKDNKIIIDICAKKIESFATVGPLKNKTAQAVGNLSALRSLIQPDFTKATTLSDGTKVVDVLVQFRYKKQVNDDKSEIAYLGKLNNQEGNNFYIRFKKTSKQL